METREIDNVRLDFALSPSEPQYSRVIAASQAITDRVRNYNVIDREKFPPHLSLHIGAIPRSALETVISRCREAAFWGVPAIEPTKVVSGSRGYVSLQVRITPALRELHESILDVVEEARREVASDSPPFLDSLSEADQDLYRRYGNTYVLDDFDAHLSIAKVDAEHQSLAYEIAGAVLDGLGTAPAAAAEVCDIGARSEKWDVLARVDLFRSGD
jgi:Protein of unknown function (DUF1045)